MFTVPLDTEKIPELCVSIPVGPATTQTPDLSDLDVLSIPIMTFSEVNGVENCAEEQGDGKNEGTEDEEKIEEGEGGESEEETEEADWAFNFEEFFGDQFNL